MPCTQPHPLARLAVWPLGSALALALVGSATAAGPLADPTRPPTSVGAEGAPLGSAHRVNTATARALAAAAQADEPLPPLPTLQSVQVPVRGPAVALIDGRVVQPGDLLAGRRVVSIDSQGVVLQAERADRLALAGKGGKPARADGPAERIWLLGGSPKQAPGSVTASQAIYVPAVAASAALADGTQPGNPQRNAAGPRLPTAAPGPLSLAGKN